jgi:hypothetical protein
MSAAAPLLTILHPEGFRDLRAFHATKGGPVTTIGAPGTDLAAVEAFIKKFQDRDIYMGVASRIQADVRGAEGCLSLHALFADLDFKDSSEAETRARLAAFPVPPSCVVASGGGLQVYWFLLDAINLQTDAEIAKLLLVALARVLHGDLRSAEPARILRIPGTTNYKYTPPRPVTIEVYNGHVYELGTLLPHLPKEEEEGDEGKDKKSDAPIQHDLPREVRMRLAKLWLEQQPPAIEHQGGDSHTYKVCCDVAHNHDLSFEDALTVLAPWNARCQPPWPCARHARSSAGH